MSWLSRHRIHLALLVLGLIGFGAVAGSRLERQSTDPHFVLLADAWLHGRLDIDPARKRGDDWATLETVELDTGEVVKGRTLSTRPMFRIAGKGEVPKSRIKRTVGQTLHVSFPPFPAVLMLPQALVSGHEANDVIPTVLIAALILPLMFTVLRRLKAMGMSQRTSAEDVWLVVALAFGSVLFFSAVQGRVWFTAHVVGVALTLAYVWCSLEARHPMLAGLALGFATMTRPPMAFMFPLFLLEAWRVHGGRDDLAAFLRKAAHFAAPVAVIAIAAMAHNHVRFGEAGEFGHSYLAVRQQSQMETLGMFSLHYLSRNLAVALALLPDLDLRSPYVSISGHGLAVWFTMPIVLYALWPRDRPALHRSLWLCVALVAIPSLLYQNSGWFQFGYRFSLDYLALLMLLVAIGGRPLTRVARGLIIAGVIINLFGAITFGRDYRFYRTSAAAYSTVIKH